MQEILCDNSLKNQVVIHWIVLTYFWPSSVALGIIQKMIFLWLDSTFIRPYSILLVADPQPPLKQILLASVGPNADMLRNTRHHSIPPAEGALYCKRRNKKQKGQKLM